MPSTLQPWVEELTFMQQSVLLAAVRGPDGIKKDHVSKLLLRWYRRCILISAFDQRSIDNPYYPHGGSFTGPSLLPTHTNGVEVGPGLNSVWYNDMMEIVKQYLQCVDELPHHFQLHFMHAAEILGYKHPNTYIRKFWLDVYHLLVNDVHLFPESEALMDVRLGDVESQWRARESVVAKGPGYKGNNPSGCNICNRPDCDNPNGKH